LPPKEPEASGRSARRAKPGRSIRRLVIWYRRNAAVTSLVGTATSAVSSAGSMAGAAVSGAGSVAGAATSAAGSVLQPLVFDPLRRLQAGHGGEVPTIQDSQRLWVAVDGMGGDHAPGPILEGCLNAVELLPLKVRFVAEAEPLARAVAQMGLQEQLDAAIAKGRLELVASGPSVGMDEEATVVRRKRDASINLAMDLVKRGEATAVYSAGNSGAVMASAIFRLGRPPRHRRPVPHQGSNQAGAGAGRGRQHGLQTRVAAPVRPAGQHLQPGCTPGGQAAPGPGEYRRGGVQGQ
jgi:glycerol-3-phosphate acyltransferase PlsX